MLFAATGCGGAGDGDKTFQGEGYGFSYPGDWAEQESYPLEGGGTGATPDIVVAPPEGGQSLVSLTVIHDALHEPFTEAGIDRIVQELRPAVDNLIQRASAVLGGDVTDATYAGLPGIRFEATSTKLDPPVEFQAIWLLDGTTGYTFNCQFVRSRAEEVRRACDLVLRSFRLGD